MYDNCITGKILCNQSAMNQLNYNLNFSSKVNFPYIDPQKLYFLFNQSRFSVLLVCY